MPRVFVLRLGHRPIRDKRLTTHACLTARAFGASGVVYSGIKDRGMESRVKEVVERWGGQFGVEYVQDWRRFLREWKKTGTISHLTMYGLSIEDRIQDVPTDRDNLVVVGSEKVSGQVFDVSDFNLAIGHQPHSEVAALAIYLDRIFKGLQLKAAFKNARLSILPREKGKTILETRQTSLTR